MSYLSLEKRIEFAETKAEILQASKDYSVREINAVIKSLKEKSSDLRKQAYELTEKASILDDEVRRQAEEMQVRLLEEYRLEQSLATTDDLK